MTGIVVRPDLSTRTALSKSQLLAFDACPTQAWWDIHERRPLIPSERLTFGSAIDAAVEQIVQGTNLALEAAAEVVKRDAVPIEWAEVERAVGAFEAIIYPRFDWTYVATQPDLHTDLPGIGPVSGHPDLVLADGSVLDVKTSSRQKDPNVGASVELGFYALLLEAMGQEVPEVGYLTWVRSSKGWWQQVVGPVTDEHRRYTRARVAAFVRARDLDAALSDGEAEPVNYAMNGGPKYGCASCAYNPDFGGRCEIAQREVAA